ncbi:MAG: hypothetical protein GY930_07615 [bacterium]|nr:hypothetical protein [bacterium]
MLEHTSMLAMIGFQELLVLTFLALIWVLAPIAAYALIRKQQNRKPSGIWILLMFPFGWMAFLAAILSGS